MQYLACPGCENAIVIVCFSKFIGKHIQHPVGRADIECDIGIIVPERKVGNTAYIQAKRILGKQ